MSCRTAAHAEQQTSQRERFMRLTTIAILLFIAGCDSPSDPDDRWAVPEEIEFAASLEIDLAQMNLTESGLYWIDIEPGNASGPTVVLEDVVTFHYTIWLPDGRSVETTRGATPFQNEVLLLIPGVAEGITGMRPGGKRKLVIRPGLAWPNGNDPIPPITTIVYEIELIAIAS
jgi:FKBP-type peptidyl-prolyl cis-trans isomerase